MQMDPAWADLVDPASDPLQRASAVSALGGGGGLDLSSAFSLGSGAAGGGADSLGVRGGVADPGSERGAGLGGISPMLAELTRQQFKSLQEEGPSSEDKGLALAQAGFAMAAGQSPHGLSNIGAGAVAGIESLQKLKEQRALQRARALQTLQTAQYHQDQIGQTAALRKIQADREADYAKQGKDRADHYAAMEDAENWTPGGVTADGKVVLINKKDGSTKTIDANAKGAASAIPDLPPDELRKKLPKSEVATADAIIEGRIKPPSAGARSQSAQRLLSIVNQLDPTFDATNTDTRFNTASFFSAKGLGGQAVNSSNTLVGHLGNLDKHIDDLGNTEWATFGNSVKNYLDTKSGKINPATTAAIGKYNTDVDVATRELQRLLTRTGGTGEEAQELRSRLASAKTPTELHAVVQEMVELMDSRLGALADQKTRGMGKPVSVWTDFYSPRSRTALAKISPTYASHYTNPQPAAAAEAPQPSAAAANDPLARAEAALLKAGFK